MKNNTPQLIQKLIAVPQLKSWANQYDCVVIRGSALQPVDLGSIPKSSHTGILTAPMLNAQHEMDSVKQKPESLLIMSLCKALNETNVSSYGRQVVGSDSLLVVEAQSNKSHSDRA